MAERRGCGVLSYTIQQVFRLDGEDELQSGVGTGILRVAGSGDHEAVVGVEDRGTIDDRDRNVAHEGAPPVAKGPMRVPKSKGGQDANRCQRDHKVAS